MSKAINKARITARKVWEAYWRERVPGGYLIHHVDNKLKLKL